MSRRSPLSEVPFVLNTDVLNFDDARRHLSSHEPVVVRLKESMKEWDCSSILSIEKLSAALRDAKIPVSYVAQTSKAPHLTMRFSDFLAKILEPGYYRSVRRLYIEQKRVPLNIVNLFSYIFPFIRKFDSQFELDSLDYTSRFFLFFAGRYSLTECHEHGGYEALLFQISGTKEVLLHKPTRANFEALYADPKKYENWSPVHPLDPDYDNYPKYSDVSSHYTRVSAGEALYIPDGWYHSVASLGDAPSVGLTYFFPQRFLDFQAEPRRLQLHQLVSAMSFREKRQLMHTLSTSARTMESLATARNIHRSQVKPD
ncbi:cupin-like domain-containing protein [uncultured Gemmobacter sp.]|uniref:cupin-like domain-containing protein n=1 Tax=uncultured Gemmobacter sp. TaxID=1095917 RepID=UPI000A518C8A